MDALVISVPGTLREVSELGDVITRVFNADTLDPWWERWVGHVGQENLVQARRADRVVGGFGVFRAGVWFGGRALPVGAVAAVGIRPEERGSGVGRALMEWHLRDLHRQGIPLSVLYPATVPFYRRFGYELAGSRVIHALSPWSLDLGVRDLFARPFEPAYPHLGVMADLYDRAARRSNGFFARSEGFWRRALDPRRAPVNTLVVGPTEAPEGYVVWHHSGLREVTVHECVTLTPRALARIFTLLADLRTIEDVVYWPGPPVDLRLAGLASRSDKNPIAESKSWMLRVVRVAEALRGRGYPSALAGAELAFEIEDPLLPDNAGSWVLYIQDGGHAEVARRAGAAPLRLRIDALAPLYTGFWRASELAEQGLVEGSTEALALADHAFSGAHPWVADAY